MIPHLRDKKNQQAVQHDAEAIARILNMTRAGHIHESDFFRGQCAVFSAMHKAYASDGHSKWTIHEDGLIALLSWDGKGAVITGEVHFNGEQWIGKSTWKRKKE